MIIIAIIDDDKAFMENLSEQIAQVIDTDFHIDTFTNENIFFDSFSEDKSYQIVIIDIMLGISNGIELAKKVSEYYKSAEIIFTSVEQDFLMDVYAVPHTYFLTKPINLEHLKRALTISIKSAEKYSISINYNKSTYVVPIAKVSYIEGYGKSSVIHGCDGSINEVPVPLRFFDDPLKEYPYFIRIHQSYIINLEYMIKYTHRKEISLKSASSFPISRKFADKVNDAVTRYLSNV